MENRNTQEVNDTTFLVPYEVFKGVVLKHEREINKMVIALIVSILVTLITNMMWLYAWTRYDYESTTETRIYSQDGEGVNMIGSNVYGSEAPGTDSNHNN